MPSTFAASFFITLQNDLLLSGEVRVIEVLEVVDDLVANRLVLVRRDLRRVTGCGIASGQVEVDLGGSASVALFGKCVAGVVVPGSLAALRQLPLCSLLQPEVDERLAHVDRVPLRREAVIREHGLAGQQRACSSVPSASSYAARM